MFSGLFALDCLHDGQEALDRRQPFQRIHDPVEIESHVLMDDHISKARRRFKLLNEIGRKSLVECQVARRSQDASPARLP